MSNWKALLSTSARRALARAERHGWDTEEITDEGHVDLYRDYYPEPGTRRRRLRISITQEGETYTP